MDVDKRRRTSFHPRGLADFLLVCCILGFLIALHSTFIDSALGLLWLGLLIASSVVIVWRWWRYPNDSRRHGTGQLAALPRSWRKWMLGDDKERHP